jgi:fatty-acyl-CoA synthase
VCEDRQVTYAELHRRANRVGNALRSARVGFGSRVAFLGRESEHYYTTVLGAAAAGAVLVPINWRLTGREIDHILRDSDAEVLFVERDFQASVDRARASLPALRAVVPVDDDEDRGGGLLAWCATAPDTVPLPVVTGPDDAVVQIYTSGTTGLPKGVVLAHRSFFTLPAAMRAAGVCWIDWRPDDVNLIALPGFGIAGLSWFLHGFVAGGTNVVMRMFVAQEAVRLIERCRVTTTFVAPAMLRLMLAESGVGPATFASLRKVSYGAAPMSEELLRHCVQMLGCEFAQIYASTETGSVAVCLPPEEHRKETPSLRSVGRPCPGNELKVIDPDGHECAPGQIGQVCIRTPARMLGYWRLPEATQRTLAGEWLRMGDAGYLDDNGYLYLCDRINDTIIVGGQNIYPAEVEQEIGAHPGVADVAVVGVPDSRWGEAVHACVVPREDHTVTDRQLVRFLRGRIAAYKIPTAYHVVTELPRNPSGKILRRVVRENLTVTPRP